MFRSIENRFEAVVRVAIVATAFFVAGCGERMSREDFAARIKDQSEKQVIKSVGKADSVENVAPDRVHWIYLTKTFNIEKGNTFDPRTIVVFTPSASGGELKVSDVKFE